MRRLVFLAAACAAALAIASTSTSPARAEDPRKAQADALYAEARTLHERERHTEALEKFEQSYKVLPSPNTLVAIAREEQLLKRNVIATRHLREALKQPMLNPNNVPAAKERLAELEALIGRLTIRGPAGARVHVADLDVRLPLDEALDVEPGPVTASGDLDGKRFAATTTATAGKLVTINLQAADASDPPTPPPSEPSTSGSSNARWIVPGAIGLAGLTAIGFGIGFGLASESAKDESERLRTPGLCQPGGAACDDYTGKRDDAESQSRWSKITWTAGGILVAGAIVTYLVWPKSGSTRGNAQSPRTAYLVPIIGRDFAGSTFSTSF